MPDVSASNVVAGLIGGGAASVLTFAGAFYLQTRTERQVRRARLMALETELRWNRIAVQSIVDENMHMGDLTDDCWTGNYVALAADLPADTYSNLRLHYYAFSRAVQCYDRFTQARATDDDREFMVWWSRTAEVMQALVTGELHTTWKLRLYASTLVARTKRFVSGRRTEEPGGKAQES